MPRTENRIMDGWEFALNDNCGQFFRKVNLPHDWTIYTPFQKDMEEGEAQGFKNRWGIGWYRRSYLLEQKQEGYRYFLDFGGIYENSTVWVNETEVGGWKYGYTSFRLDITEAVLEGENRIVIKVDNTAKPSDRWYSGAGIYRTVKWIEVEEQHFEEREVTVNTRIDGYHAIVKVETGVKGRITAVLSDETSMMESSSESGEVEFHITDAKLWSAENPHLYQLTLTLLDAGRITDSISMRIGICDIKMIPGSGMFVNNERVIIKGVCVHQDLGCRGTANKPELWRERLKQLKIMGCNAIRAAHHTFSSEFLDLCDEMGFYVYEECFDKWTGGLYGRYFQTEWEKDLTAMVKRDRNRACIFMWGVGNEVENQAQDSMLKILKMLLSKVRSLDSTRPCTYAMNPHFKRESDVEIQKIKNIQEFVDEVSDTEIYDMEERLDRISRIAELVDVICCNYQEQWYDEIHARFPDKLILGTETYQFFKGHLNQMQNFTVENPQLVPFEKAHVIGGMIWTGFDYLGESMGYPAKGWSGAPIRTNGCCRPAFYMLQSYWSSKPMVHISVMDYSLEDEGVKEHWDMPIYADHWHFPQFHKTIIPYMIATNCDEVRLFLNEKEFYVQKPELYPNQIITGFLPWKPGTVKVIGIQDGREVCSHELITPGQAVKLMFDQSEFTLDDGMWEDGYEILLTVRAMDIHGIPYFRESTRVRFRIEGSAEIIAVDNGNLMDSEPYDESFIHMYHGQASVILCINKKQADKSGRIVVYADAEGMQSGRMILYTK
nr:glycoside hydrolase family 2 TIM barrel-domain containing protein [uncultured Clostridium sp.]